jgi:hydrogenase maturation protease
MKTLVIGYGNTLRGDDGLGYRMAEIVETWKLPDVIVLPRHQLTPELALDLAGVDRVIFVDATPPQNPHSPILVERLEAKPDGTFFSGHHSSPTTLLALAAELYSKQPLAYALLLPSWAMGYGETLSPIAQTGMQQGLRRLRELLTVWND